MRILHVSDSYNAGVLQAIEILVNRFPEHEHLLLWASHDDSPPPTSNYLNSVFPLNWKWRRNILLKYLQLTKLVSTENVEVLHLHSSVAGFIGRLILNKVPILYSPHCFAFQRKDISKFQEMLFLIIERLLAVRSCHFALCWPVEIQLALKYFKRTRIFFIPIINVNELKRAQLVSRIKNGNIACVGRIRPQKDPSFLIQAAFKNPSIISKLVWIGSGDTSLINALNDIGIRVIPWMEQAEIFKPKMKLNATCITSAWESGPLTLFESLKAGLPVLCRSIEATDIYGFPTFATSQDFSNAVNLINESSRFRKFLFEIQIKTVISKFEEIRGRFSVPDPYQRIAKLYG